MKKFLLRYKKSKSINPTSKEKKVWSGIVVVGCTLVVGCAIKIHESTKQNSPIAAIVEKITSPEPEYINVIYKNPNGIRYQLGKVNNSICSMQPIGGEFEFETDVHTYFEVNRIKLKWKANQPETAYEVENFSFQIASKSELPTLALNNSICTEKSSENSIIVTDINWHDSIEQRLTLAFPDCKLKSTTENGWTCEYQGISFSDAENRLSTLQKNMIRKWSRQPYLFSRRLSISKNFATSYQKNSELAVRRLCRTIESSRPEELPIIFANTNWSSSVCTNKPELDLKERAKSFEYGMLLATKELEYLYEEVEKSSRIGLIQIKIPANESPSKNLWISLSPMAKTVADAIDNSTAQKNSYFDDKVTTKWCWHPLFSKTTRQNKAANDLKLLNIVNEQTNCLSAKDNKVATLQKINEELVSYVDQSIIGETEFLVANGNSKILRLPLGEYEYTAYELPANAAEWSPTPETLKSSGKISWSTKRPRIVIKDW